MYAYLYSEGSRSLYTTHPHTHAHTHTHTLHAQERRGARRQYNISVLAMYTHNNVLTNNVLTNIRYPYSLTNIRYPYSLCMLTNIRYPYSLCILTIMS